MAPFDGLGRLRGDEEGFAAEHGSPTLTDGRHHAKDRAAEEVDGFRVEVVLRRERDGHADEDDEAGHDLDDGGKGCSQPEPFDGRADGRRETLHEQQCEPGTQARQRLIRGNVTQAEADESAPEEEAQARAAESFSKSAGPNREEHGREGQPREIGQRRAQMARRARRADSGDRPEKRREDGGKHGANEIADTSRQDKRVRELLECHSFEMPT